MTTRQQCQRNPTDGLCESCNRWTASDGAASDMAEARKARRLRRDRSAPTVRAVRRVAVLARSGLFGRRGALPRLGGLGYLRSGQDCELMKGKAALSNLVDKIDNLQEIQAHLENYPYVNFSFLFEQTSVFMIPFKLVLMPALNVVLAMYSRVKAIKAA